MAAERTTPQQSAHDKAYHNRQETLRELAFANLLERPLSEETDFTLATFYGLASGSVVEAGFSFGILVAVGGTTTPSAEIQLSHGGERFQRIAADGAYTGYLYAAAIANQKALVVGEDEEIQEVITGIAAQKNTGGAEDLKCICFCVNDTWLAGGTGGKILKSVDNADTWAAKDIPAGGDIIGIAYGKNRALAVDTDGNYYYSNDLGENWSAAALIPIEPTATAFEPSGVIFDGTQFIAFGEVEDATKVLGEYGAIAVSVNGLVFGTAYAPETDSNFPDDTGGINFTGMAFGDDIYVLYGQDALLFSLDGMETWSFRWQPCQSSHEISVAAYLDGIFHFLGQGEPHPGALTRHYRTQKYF
jgi:hypothetical protein